MKKNRLYGMLGAALFLTFGCSKQGYDYAIPPKICGIGVDESALKPILPTGKEGKTTDSGSQDFEHRICRVIVDKDRALSLSILRDWGGVDAFDDWKKEFDNLRRVAPKEDVANAAVADDGAVATLKCLPKPDQPEKGLAGIPYTHLSFKFFVGDKVKSPNDVADRRANIERFMWSYIPDLTETWCR
ncbi:hypothetical protein [Streptomyces antibioticus]|uniref:hypothetical protein n=1 Tax=Streptomyces antibioticus TaxID=1890 RepID=UPI0033EA07CF